MKDGFEDLCWLSKDWGEGWRLADLVVKFAFSKDELAQTPFDGEDVGEDGSGGEGELHTRQIECSWDGSGSVLDIRMRGEMTRKK